MVYEIKFKGIEALQLADDRLRLTVIPRWGGKVAELFDVRRQREWLFENPALFYRLPEYGADYGRDFDVGGFDECFPTIKPCPYPAKPWQGTPLPDHGEIWSIPWTATVEGEMLHLVTQGRRLPYRFEKSIRLLGDGAACFRYRLVNLSRFPMPFIWSSHPMLAIRPGMQLTLPVESMRVFYAPAFPAQSGQVIAWPRFQDLDLSRVPEPGAGMAVKLFSPRLSEGWAALADPEDGANFRFEFDPAAVTHFGLWLNYGGWTGVPGTEPYFNLAPEPCIGGAGALDTAMEWQEYGLLPANGTQQWWLRVIVS